METIDQELNSPPLNRTLFKWAPEEFAWRMTLLVVLAIITRQFIFERVLQISIPGLEWMMIFAFFGILFFTNSLSRQIPKTYFTMLIISSAFAALSHFFSGAAPFRFLPGWIYTYTFPLIFLLFFNIKMGEKQLQKLIRALTYCLSFFLLCSYAEAFLFLDNPITLFLRDSKGVYAYISYQSAWTAFGVVFSLYLFRSTKEKRWLLISSWMTLSLMLLSFRKSFAAAVLIWIFFALLDGNWKTKLKRISIISIVGAVFLFTLGDFMIYRFKNLKAYSGEEAVESVARTVMLVKSFEIAKDRFPFGSGLGTFASTTAYDHYSLLYYEFGLSEIKGMEPHAGRIAGAESYLLDTFWPHIIAELGFIGTLIFLFFWIYPPWLAWRLREKVPNGRSILLLVWGVFLVIFLESTGSGRSEKLQFILIWAGLIASVLGNTLRQLKEPPL